MINLKTEEKLSVYLSNITFNTLARNQYPESQSLTP